MFPVLWFYELGNGLTMACRRKRITTDQAAEYLVRIERLRVFIEPADPGLILALPDLARMYELTIYDAAYLQVAIRRQIALATTDDALRRAATKAGVALFNPDAPSTTGASG